MAVAAFEPVVEERRLTVARRAAGASRDAGRGPILVFVISGVLLAATDWIANHAKALKRSKVPKT
jgi:hypothetical protein